MLKSKATKNEAIIIPAKIAKKLALKEGTIVEARVEKGKLLILGKKNKANHIMRYAGIWEKEEVEKIFGKIHRDWAKWQKNLPV
ncbi:MAG: AbrB/MazE/SpoVT family DNA-binding domain-containing protein [Proteobacteria bacterium]|nr:AbrB/MazE/SpoVT family DNA-binding domain-containing protein [Pseudomonadota bacterium]